MAIRDSDDRKRGLANRPFNVPKLRLKQFRARGGIIPVMKSAISVSRSVALFGWIGMTSAVFGGTAAKDTIQRQFTVTPGSRLIVDSDYGDLELKAGESSEFKITVVREVHCKTEAEGQKWLADRPITFDQTGDTVTVKATNPSLLGKTHIFNNPGFQVHYTLVVPNQTRAELKTSGGNIVVGDLTGELTGHTSGGDIQVAAFQGPVVLGTSGGGIHVKAAAKTELSTTGGDITVGQISGTLNARTSGGGIEVGDVRGAIEVKTSGGDIKLGTIGGPVKANTSGGGIRVKVVDGEAVLETSGGDIQVDHANQSLRATTSGGGIQVGHVVGSVDLKTSAGDITITEASGSVQGYTSGGGIRAGLSKTGASQVSLSTSGGDIHLSLPTSAKYDIDAKASGGDVTTDIPVTTTGKQSDGTLKGQFNGGGQSLKLKTSGGNIHIKHL